MSIGENKKKMSEVRSISTVSVIFFNPFPVRDHRELISWLVPGQHNAKHEEALSRWHGTGRCAWILSNDIFTKWRSDGGFLWLHGIRVYRFPILYLSEIDKLLSWERQVYAHVSLRWTLFRIHQISYHFLDRRLLKN